MVKKGIIGIIAAGMLRAGLWVGLLAGVMTMGGCQVLEKKQQAGAAVELNGQYLNYLDYDKFRFHVLSDSICLDSDKNRADRLSVLVNAGVITPNEARKTLNLGSAAGGDQLHEPKSNKTPANGEKGGEK